MCNEIGQLLENNRRWSAAMQHDDPDYFSRLANLQLPRYLWIGCSDSRVPANQVVGLDPGDLFVHRNIANMVIHSDLNCQSVLQFAVDVLRVKHVLVVGHHGCGGVMAAFAGKRLGLADNWVRHIRYVRQKHAPLIDGLSNDNVRLDALCELNIIEQAQNVCDSIVVRDAWERGQELSIHAWVYSLVNGRIHDLSFSAKRGSDCEVAYRRALGEVERCRASSSVNHAQ